MHDVVIVGGRCAGAPLALLLARAGHDVLIVERTTFPSDTMSTHFIQAPGVVRLARWGLLDEILATEVPVVRRARVHTDEVTEFELPERPSFPGLIAPRRYILDKLLVDAAVSAGAKLAEGVSVDRLLFEDDRVVGVSGHDKTGDFEARGRFVVGADGRHSTVAREVEAPFESYHDPVTSGYYAYFSGVEMNAAAETVMHDELFAVCFPTHDDLTLVGLAWRPDRFKDLKRDVDGNFRTGLSALGELGERILAGERAERYVGTADVPNFLRRAYGPGWALIGDALFHKDPVPADGISDAFRAADYLASALDDALTGRKDEATALETFKRRHDAIAVPELAIVIRTASFDVAPRQRFEAFFELRIRNEEEVDGIVKESLSA